MNGSLIGSVSGELVGNIMLTQNGKTGQALYTDGVSQYVNLGSHRDKCVANLVLCTEGISIALWLKTGDTGNDEQYYLSNGGQTPASHGFSLRKRYGSLHAHFRTLSGTLWIVHDASTPVDGLWHHVMVTWKQDIGANLYVDGQWRDDGNPGPVNAQDDSDNFYIGRRSDRDMEYGMAWYDDLRVYHE